MDGPRARGPGRGQPGFIEHTDRSKASNQRADRQVSHLIDLYQTGGFEPHRRRQSRGAARPHYALMKTISKWGKLNILPFVWQSASSVRPLYPGAADRKSTRLNSSHT